MCTFSCSYGFESTLGTLEHVGVVVTTLLGLWLVLGLGRVESIGANLWSVR